MSEPSKKPDPPKSDPPKSDPPKSDPPKSDPPKSDPPKKLEARTAGAPNTTDDVFKLPDFPEDEQSTANDEHGEEKISMTEALKMKSKDWAKAARRKSGQILTRTMETRKMDRRMAVQTQTRPEHYTGLEGGSAHLTKQTISCLPPHPASPYSAL
jgi:hypothetical protein